jgi:hypothetical protein
VGGVDGVDGVDGGGVPERCSVRRRGMTLESKRQGGIDPSIRSLRNTAVTEDLLLHLQHRFIKINCDYLQGLLLWTVNEIVPMPIRALW